MAGMVNTDMPPKGMKTEQMIQPEVSALCATKVWLHMSKQAPARLQCRCCQSQIWCNAGCGRGSHAGSEDEAVVHALGHHAAAHGAGAAPRLSGGLRCAS